MNTHNIKLNICFMGMGMEAFTEAGIGMAIQEGAEALGAGIDAAFQGAKLRKQWKKGVQKTMQNEASADYYNPNALDPNDPTSAFANLDSINTTVNADDILEGMGMNSFFLGGLISNISSNIQQKRYKRKAKQLAPQIMAMRENAKDSAIFAQQQNLNNVTNRDFMNNARSFYNAGGWLAESPFNVFRGGYKHDDIVPFGNMHKGIPQGYAEDGTKNVVETGEVIDKENNYVVSNSTDYISKEYGGWIVTEEDAIKYNLPKWAVGKSPAGVAEKINALAESRSNTDPITNDTVRVLMDRIESLNEEKRMAQQTKDSLDNSKEEYKAMMNHLKNNKIDINEILAEQKAREEQQYADMQQQKMQMQNSQIPQEDNIQYSAFGGFSNNKVVFTKQDVEAMQLPEDFVGKDIKDVISSLPPTQENLDMINKLMSLYNSRKNSNEQLLQQPEEQEFAPGGFLRSRRAAGLSFKDVKNLGRKKLKNVFKNKTDVLYDSLGNAYYSKDAGDLKDKVNTLVNNRYGISNDIKDYKNTVVDKDGNLIAKEGSDVNEANREIQDYQAKLKAKQIAEQNKQNRLAELIPAAASALFPAIAMGINNVGFGEPDTNALRNLAYSPKKLNYDPVGSYLKVVLPNYGEYLAALNKNTRTTSNELYNSNQSIGALNAANLALHNQATSKLGETKLNIDNAYNKALGEQAAFNLGIDQNNAKNKLSTNIANVESDLKYQQLLSDNYQRADLIDSALAAKKREDFLGSFAALGNTINNLTPQLVNPWVANNNPYSDFSVDAKKKDGKKFGGKIRNRRKIKSK